MKHWHLSLCSPQLSGICTSEPSFCCYHGNYWKISYFEFLEKFVGKYCWILHESWLQNLSPSWSNRASKSAFPDFHGNRLKFSISAFAIPTSDPDRLSVTNFIEIRQETREEMQTVRRWATKTGDYYIDRCLTLSEGLVDGVATLSEDPLTQITT